MRIAGSDISFEISPERAQALAGLPQDTYILGIRPQNLLMANGATGFAAEVLINEYLGERSILTVRSGQTNFRALVPPDTAAGKGDNVRLAVDPRNVMVFDARSGALVA
jgi:ABC-type sugar transport system ATPase subunit